MSLPEAAGKITDGQLVAVGGNALHRSPVTFCREMAKQQRKGLRGVGAAPGLATDLLCAAGVLKEIYFGFFGFENEYGLAPGMRRGIQAGTLKALEGS